MKYLANGRWFLYSILVLYVLISIRFFDYSNFNSHLLKLFSFIIIIPVLFFCWNIIVEKTKEKIFRLYRIILIITISSMFSAFVFWDQDLMLGYRVTTSSIAPILFFFLLYKTKASINFCEKYILCFALLYCVLWLYALSKIPEFIFGVSDEDASPDEMRGFVRINFYGCIELACAYFLSLNKLIISRKPIYLVYTVLFIVFLVLQLTRQLIFGAILITIIYLFVYGKKIFIIGALIVSITLLMGKIKIEDNSIIGSLITLSEEQIDDNDENIRISEYRYYFTDFSPNLITDIIGNGLPHDDSPYGRYNKRLQNTYHYFISDVGYARMYAMTGLIGLFSYLFLFYYSIKAKIPKEMMYAKMFVAFVAFISIGTCAYASCFVFPLCLYLIMKQKSFYLKQ